MSMNMLNPLISDSAMKTNASIDNNWPIALHGENEIPVESAAEAALRYREREIERREKQLSEKEENIRVREEKIEQIQGQQFNWPWFRPILYHDINKDIPSHGRKLVRRMYGLWMITTWTYCFNCIACLSLLATQHPAGGTMFGMSLIIAVAAIPITFSFWYKQLYDGVRDNKSVRFFLFFINFVCHIGATAALGIGISGWGGAGILITIDQFSRNLGSAIVCTIASISFGVQFALSIWAVRDVTVFYRSEGHSTERAKSEAVRGTLQSTTGQAIIKEGAKQVSRSTKAGHISLA